MFRIAFFLVHVDFNKRHEMSRQPAYKLIISSGEK